ncbi:hypothetical protein C0993_002025 [Termitomyces sp. T159_Od127]|nr:hypothetical protein C0993_002025 [Termitomyces sp. T159_Od127]
MSDLLHSAFSHTTIPYSRPGTPSSHAPKQIGFVGLGAIGYLMATNLANQHSSPNGHPPLLVWNRSIAKAEKLLAALGKDKIRIAQDLAQIASECDVIITNLAHDTVVKSIYEKFAETLKAEPFTTKQRIFVETSTIYPTLAGELDVLISAVPHAHLVTCPVFGAPAVAAKGQLIIVMSGDYRSKKEIAYLFVPGIGCKVVDLGENLEKAPTFKLIGNSMILGTLEVLAEAYTLAEKSGIDAENVHNLVQGEQLDSFGSVITVDAKWHGNQTYYQLLGFSIDGGIKDASHIRRLTAELNSPMPAIDVAHQHLLTARAIHQGMKQEGKAVYETLDWSGIVAGTRVAAGLDGLDSNKHDSVVRED